MTGKEWDTLSIPADLSPGTCYCPCQVSADNSTTQTTAAYSARSGPLTIPPVTTQQHTGIGSVSLDWQTMAGSVNFGIPRVMTNHRMTDATVSWIPMLCWLFPHRHSNGYSIRRQNRFEPFLFHPNSRALKSASGRPFRCPELFILRPSLLMHIPSAKKVDIQLDWRYNSFRFKRMDIQTFGIRELMIVWHIGKTHPSSSKRGN